LSSGGSTDGHEKVITSLFQTYGYGIESHSASSRYVLATKDGVNLSIGYVLPSEEVATKDILNFLAISQNDSAQKSIFICISAVMPEIKRIAEDGNVTLWDRERFEREIGRAMLKDLEKIKNGEEGIFLSGLVADIPLRTSPNYAPSPLFATSPTAPLARTASSSDINAQRADELGIIVHTKELARRFVSEGMLEEPGTQAAPTGAR